MSKKQAILIIVISVFLAETFNIFFGPTLSAKISTWPLLNHWHILSPQAPIVITNRQTVRVNNSGDAIAALSQVKSQISSVVLVVNGSDTVTGSSLNLTSDGDFVTASQSFSQANGNYLVLLNDGRSAKISSRVLDPGTSLVFFKASLSSVPVVNLAASKDAGVGDQVIFVSDSLQSYTTRASFGNINMSQSDIEGQTFLSDYPRRGFVVQTPTTLVNGEALISTGASLLGIWNGSAIISSDVLAQAVNLYLADGQKINRPAFGFSYQIVTQNESSLNGNPQGALVKQVTVSSPARQAGLLAGDIITAVGGTPINETSPLEETLQNYRPNDQITLTIARKSQTLTLDLAVGELH